MGFEVGDRVRIRQFQEEWRNQDPGFTYEMEEYCGKEFIIDSKYKYVSYEGWVWHDDWLEPAEEEAEDDVDLAEFEAVISPIVKG